MKRVISTGFCLQVTYLNRQHFKLKSKVMAQQDFTRVELLGLAAFFKMSNIIAETEEPVIYKVKQVYNTAYTDRRSYVR